MSTSVADVIDGTLTHYGIKGMKWGVRRTRKQIDADSSDTKAAKEVKAKISRNKGSTNPLTNQELQSLNTRMNLEQNYKQLVSKEAQSRKNASALKRGQKATKEILDVGKTVSEVYNFTQTPMVKSIKQQIEEDKK